MPTVAVLIYAKGWGAASPLRNIKADVDGNLTAVFINIVNQINAINSKSLFFHGHEHIHF